MEETKQTTQLKCETCGLLPASQFYECDIARKRNVCKACHRARTRRYRHKYPLRQMWFNVVRAAQRKWPTAAEPRQWSWKMHGRAIMRQLSSTTMSTFSWKEA